MKSYKNLSKSVKFLEIHDNFQKTPKIVIFAKILDINTK
jgi:hypothetical protein